MPHKPSALRPVAAFGLALAAAVLPPGGAARASDMAAEYGPEAEALFVQICADDPGATPAACRRLAEGLQARLGYEAFLAGARRGPVAFAAEPAAFGAPAHSGAVTEVRGASLAAR